MKVELNLEEINEGIALYLRERKLSGCIPYEISNVCHHDNDGEITVTAVIGQRNDTPQPCPVAPSAPRAY
ncbi:hypothetical protein VPH159E362A_0032 [Vibrio phage 159E36-2a]